MEEIFETKEECMPVEKAIWDVVAFSYGCEFVGVKRLSIDALYGLRAAVDRQLHRYEVAGSDDD